MIRRSLPLGMLSPRERTAIEYAARFRGDDSYADTVASVAEKTTWHITDTHGSRHGFIHAAYLANGEMLEAVGMYWRHAGLACGLGLEGYPKDEADEQMSWALKVSRAWAYIYRAKWEGWVALCEELGLDADQWLEALPGVYLHEGMAIEDGVCPTEDEAASILRDVSSKELPSLLTAQSYKAKLLEVVEEFEAVWS